MVRGSGVGEQTRVAWPPSPDMTLGMPGLESKKLTLRNALRWPALATTLEASIKKRKPNNRSLAASAFINLVKEDRKRCPIPVQPKTNEGLSPYDFLTAVDGSALCRLLLAEDLRDDECLVRDAIREYQQKW